LQTKSLIVLLLLTGLLQACVAVDPSKGRNEEASDVNTEMGLGYLQQNNFELASEKLLKALRQNPESVKANYVYAVLQDKLEQKELAEYHYEKATKLDPKNSEAANNFGAFLCRNGRQLESEKYFKRALKNPLYKTPEYAYTNAAICMLQADELQRGKEYLGKAIAAKSDFGPALLSMADVLYKEGDYSNAKIYLDRYHLVSRASARSLWLAIRNTLELDGQGDIEELAQRLETEFPDSQEYVEWKQIQ
jgi:type IV pilus assembly protein PilF